MKKKNMLRRKKIGANNLPRFVDKKRMDFKISPIHMDDLILSRIQAAASSSECL